MKVQPLLPTLSLLLSAALLLSGCAGRLPPAAGDSPASPPAQEAPVPPFPPTVHQLYPPNSATPLFLDAQGKPLPADYLVPFPLHDRETHQVRYYSYTKIEDTGVREDGWPVLRHLSRLCTPDGTPLRDWEEYTYRAAFGSLLIRSQPHELYTEEEPSTALWDPLTGQTVVEGAYSAEPLSQGRYLLCAYSGAPIAIVDTTGTVLSVPPTDHSYGYASPAYNGYLIAADPEFGTHSLLDSQFHPVLTADSLNTAFYAISGDYLLVGNAGEPYRLHQDPTQPPVYTLPNPEMELEYFDGQLAILRSGGSWDNGQYCLVRTQDGQVLAQDFDSLSFHERYTHPSGGDLAPSQVFLGRRGEDIQLLDREGTVLAQRSIPGLTAASILTPQRFTYTVSSNLHDTPICGLLDRELSTLLPADRYTSILLQPFYQQDSLPQELLSASVVTPQNTYRIDLLTLDGKPLLQNLHSYSPSQEGIAVVQGFHYGLVDWEGNWVTRHSIFDLTQED